MEQTCHMCVGGRMAVSMGGQASGRICNGAKKHVGAEVCSKNVS